MVINIPCKNGKNCSYLKRGKCNFYHSPEERKNVLCRRMENKNRKREGFKKYIFRTYHKGCEECEFTGCKKCFYRKICGISPMPKPTTCLNDYKCYVCGKVRDEYYQLCEACGS